MVCCITFDYILLFQTLFESGTSNGFKNATRIEICKQGMNENILELKAKTLDLQKKVSFPNILDIIAILI